MLDYSQIHTFQNNLYKLQCFVFNFPLFLLCVQYIFLSFITSCPSSSIFGYNIESNAVFKMLTLPSYGFICLFIIIFTRPVKLF